MAGVAIGALMTPIVSVILLGGDEFDLAPGNYGGDLSRQVDHVDRFHTGIECLSIDIVFVRLDERLECHGGIISA